MLQGRIRQLVRAVLGAGLCGAAIGNLLAIQTDTRGTHAVPAPGQVVIDGKLADWDLSGKYLQCYDVETLKDVYSGELAFMYDAANLYVAIHWQDPIPMGNSHDPRYQAGKGWAGDSVQLRFKTDRICHVTAWYYAKEDEPAIGIDYGKSLSEPFGGGQKLLLKTAGTKLTEGAEMAFRKDADGKGYVQEIKLPWPLLADQWRPAPGDAFRCGVELLWGEADWPVHRYADNLDESANSREFFWTAHNAWGLVRIEPKGKLKLAEPSWSKAVTGSDAVGPQVIAYTLPKAARVTIVIDDPNGKRVRNLIAALPRQAGPNRERWDGLDDNGVPVMPGQYRWKGLYHDGIHLNWDMSFASPGNPPWDTSDGRGAFYGDHSAPHAAASAGNFVALACPIGEAGKYLIGCNLDGQRLWGLANRVVWVTVRSSLATDGKTLWVAQDASSTIYRAEMATGKYRPWEQTAKDESGKDYKVLDLKVSEFAHPKDRKSSPFGPGIESLPNLTGIALHQGVLAVCLARENKLKLLDAETGVGKIEIAVENPQAAAYGPDGSLFVLSGPKLIKLAPGAAQPVPFTAATWAAPYGLAVDAAGQVYVSVREPDHNVKVLSPAGKLLREIGKRGGRPHHGPFDELAMRNPGQLAIDAKGRLWVPEETSNPKRTSVWDLASGKFVRDFVGTTSYAGAGAIDPADPTLGFADDTVYRLDLKAGSSRPVYSFGRREDPADVFPPNVDSHARVVRANGAIYLYTTGSARGASEVHVTMSKDGQWRSVAHLGVVCDRKREKDMVGEAAKYRLPLFAGRDLQAYAWADRNGDGLVQPDEMQWGNPLVDGQPVALLSYYWGQLPDNRGLVTYRYAAQKQTRNAAGLLRFPVAGYTPCGAPLYDLAKPIVQPVEIAGGEGMLAGGVDGNVYLNTSPLTGFDRQGRQLFTYPSRHVSVHGSHTAAAARPGYLIGPSSILGAADLGGEAGEVFDLNGNLGENYLFTADGLWIQALFKDCRGGFETPDRAVRGMSFDATTAGGESFGGHFSKAVDGKVRLIVGGTDARILEVTGLDSLRRLAGTFAYTPAAFAEAAEAVKGQLALKARKNACTVARAAAPPPLDGKGSGFANLADEAKPVAAELRENWQRFLRVALTYDAANLYAAWRVYSPSAAMRNAGQDFRTLFKTGDCVDLMLGPEKAPKGEGNLRLLISTLAGQPVAVLYCKTVPGTPEKERVPFSSPWRTIAFDKVTREDGVKIVIGKFPGGYLVEAAIPWTVLGVEPKPGLKLRGDFGVLAADNGGTVTVSRRYWSNGSTGLVNDIPGEADLTPEAWSDIVLE